MVTMMTKKVASALLLFSAIVISGCTGNVETTDDSTRVETDLPKVEVGDRKPDLDPSTDDDIDVDTPAPGDN
jgi:PBP1b-binding outer membrane lipoprotein LpoB